MSLAVIVLLNKVIANRPQPSENRDQIHKAVRKLVNPNNDMHNMWKGEFKLGC